MKPLDPKWWLWVNLERLLFWRQLVSRCYCLEFRWIICAATLTPGKEMLGCLYMHKVPVTLRQTCELDFGMFTASCHHFLFSDLDAAVHHHVCCLHLCLQSNWPSTTGLTKITQTCCAQTHICGDLFSVFSLLKRNLWHSSKLPVRRFYTNIMTELSA